MRNNYLIDKDISAYLQCAFIIKRRQFKKVKQEMAPAKQCVAVKTGQTISLLKYKILKYVSDDSFIESISLRQKIILVTEGVSCFMGSIQLYFSFN